MGLITSLFFFLFSTVLLADTVHYSVRSGRLHKGGKLSIETIEEATDFQVKLSFELSKRSWVPLTQDQLKGENVTTLPSQFKDERGYQELEQAGELNLPEATVTFLGRVDFRSLKNAYFIEVKPKNGKSVNQIIYHPDLPAVGWGKIEIKFISSLAALNGYSILAEILP